MTGTARLPGAPPKGVDSRETHDCRAPGLGTPEAARAVLGAFFNIARAWRLTSDEEDVLLGADRLTCERWRRGDIAESLSENSLRRLGYVLNIYAALQVLLPVRERADNWVHQANEAEVFGGQPAIGLMLSGRTDGLRAVADYLEVMVAGA